MTQRTKLESLPGGKDRWEHIVCSVQKCTGRWIMLNTRNLEFWIASVQWCKETGLNREGGRERTRVGDFFRGNYDEDACKAMVQDIMKVWGGESCEGKAERVLIDTFSEEQENLSILPPTVLIAAGSDSSGGAGIQADLKSCEALGVYGMTALTALTAQSTKGVTAVETCSPTFVESQLDTTHSDIPAGAIKTGMLPDGPTVSQIAHFAKSRSIPIIVDPVMVSTSGCTLAASSTVESMVKHLLPLSLLVTPNIPEAAVLLNQESVPMKEFCPSVDAMKRIAHDISKKTSAKNVLLKGGHLVDIGGFDSCHDVLYMQDSEECEVLTTPWIETTNTHGTGCTLAASISAGVAKGLDVKEAVIQAKAYLTKALEASKNVKLVTMTKHVNDDELSDTSSVASILSYGMRPSGVKEHAVGVAGGSLILINTVVGGGISLVATPYAVKCLGLGSFLVCELLFGIFSTISLVMLGRVCTAANSFNLKHLAEELIGKWAGIATSFAIGLNNFFVVIAFLQIGFDVCDALFNDTASPFVIAGVACLILPIANFAHIDKIEPLAFGCTLLWLSFVVLMMVNFFVALNRNHLATHSDWEWSASFVDVILGKGLPAINLTWTVQFNATPLFGSLTPRTRKSMSAVSSVMSMTAMGLYMTYGMGTYRYYGSEIKDDIMKSINPDKNGKGLEWGHWSVMLAEGLLGTSAMGTIPFFLIESRNMVHDAITDKKFDTKTRFVETASMVAVAYAVAYLVSDLSVIIALIGVFPANVIAWILPGLLVVRLAERDDNIVSNSSSIAADTAAPPPPSFPKSSKKYGYALLAWAATLAPLGLISMFR